MHSVSPVVVRVVGPVDPLLVGIVAPQTAVRGQPVLQRQYGQHRLPVERAADDLPALDPDCIGLHGSPTKVSKTFVPVRTKQTVRIDGAQPEAAVASLLAQLDAAHISLEGGGDHV